MFGIGTSAHGNDSRRLFHRCTAKSSGEFHSVDLNPRASHFLIFQHGSRTNLHKSDSIKFIDKELCNHTNKKDLRYLDS